MSVPEWHTGSFAPNSFQINANVEYSTKRFCYFHFIIGELFILKWLKTMKAKSTFILKIISKNTKWQNMQKIPIWNVKSVISSIQILAWKCLGCQKKQKSSRNWHVLSNCAVFEPKSNKLRKSVKKQSFSHGFWSFWEVFWALFKFGWKTAQFDNKFEFLEHFHFFWHPNSSQAKICIDLDEILSKNATVLRRS